MRGKLVSLVLILCAFLLGGTGMYFVMQRQGETIIKETETTTTGIIKCSNNIKIDETGISTAVGKIYDATVTIQNYRANRLYATGSGFIYKKNKTYGYILTNQHVIENNEKIVITLSNDDQIEGEVLGSDRFLDLAVIRIDAKYVTQVATLGTSEDSYVGDTIITIGTPVGYEYRGTVTRGTLSGKNRMVEVSVVSTNDFIMNVLQIDAAINPGNSGGPLVNINGEVIGINSLKLVQDEIEGMGFAIPIEYAMQYIEELEKNEEIERPLIGISMLNSTDTYRIKQVGLDLDKDIPKGVVVVAITSDSGIFKAGIKRGDIIIAIDGKSVTTSAYLKYELYQREVGDTVEITYIRDGKNQTVKAELTKIQ